MTEGISQLYAQVNEWVSVNNVIENAVFHSMMGDTPQQLANHPHEV